MKSFTDHIFIPVVLITSLCISFVFDHSPGFGQIHQIFAFFCLSLAILSICLRFRPFYHLKKIQIGKPKLLLAILSLVISFVFFDVLFRLILPPVYKQTRYGWSMNENYEVESRVEDTLGNFRDIKIQYYKNGFKRWGEMATHKKKIFIIGDSFTEMNLVSNKEEWYSYLENKFKNVEFFVFGGGGYGSLQEYMILDDYFDIIKPDLILWQFCENDYANNLYELDALNYPYNNHAVRPYFEDGKIVYRLPLPLSSVRKYSFVADRVLGIYDRLGWEDAIKNIKVYQQKRGQERKKDSNAKKEHILQLEENGFAITDIILGKVRKRVGNIPVYMINAPGELSDKEQKLCDANKFICIESVSRYINLKEREGYEVKVVNDGHWNKLGNEIVGEKLADYFKKNHILDS